MITYSDIFMEPLDILRISSPGCWELLQLRLAGSCAAHILKLEHSYGKSPF